MINEFTTYLTSIKGYSAETGKAYGKDLRKFALFMRTNKEGARWSTITREDVDMYITWCVSEHLKPATTNRALSALNHFYCYLKRQGYEVTNPVRYESRRKIARTIPNTIPLRDLQAAHRASAGPIHTIIGVMMTTGIRVQELLDITREDLDLQSNLIRINGKGSKQRIVYSTAETMAELQGLSQSVRKGEPIFSGWSQREVRRAIYTTLSPISDARQTSPHAIRHTFATEVAKQGVNATTLAQMMGHNSIKTTQRYIDMTQQDVNQAYTMYQQLFQ